MTKPEAQESIPESERVATPPDDAGAVDAEEVRAEPEPWTPERATEWNAYYDHYVAFAVLLLAFIASANRITHSSIWNQLQVGHQIAARSAPVTTDLFSYTEAGKPWVNVPWLFDWAHAVVYKLAYGLSPTVPSDPAGSVAKAEQVGAGTLIALNALARLLTAVFLISIRRSGPGKWWSATCTALAVGAVLAPGGIELGGIAAPSSVTPGTWGLLFTAVELWLLFRATILGRRGAAFALIPLFALWANVDESFFTGLLILAAATLGLVRPAPVPKDQTAGRFGLSTALAVLVACALACLVNPSTVQVYRAGVDPLLSLFRPASDVVTIDQLSYFGKGLADQAGDRVRLLQGYYLILVALGVGSFVLNRRRFSLSRFLVFALASVLWGVLIRYQPEFALVFAVTVGLNGQEWYQDQFGSVGRVGWGWSFWSVGGRMLTITLVFLCVGKALLGGLPIPGFGPSLSDPRFGFGFDRGDFAFEAADFLKTAPIQGNILNTTMAQGDAIVWRAFPERKNYMDGRSHLFPPDVRNQLQQVRKALSEDDQDVWKPVLDRYQVSTVLINPLSAPNTHRTLSQSPNWVPFYDDGQVVMFGRTDVAADDVAFFTENRLDPDTWAYKKAKPTPAVDRPPTPVTWMDSVFQTRSLEHPQPHTESARRWLSSGDPGQAALALPDPARCLVAIREARTALAAKPDDGQAFRLLAAAYRALMTQENALLAGVKIAPENAAQIGQLPARTDLLMNRFRQRVTALNYAIQTTPPPRTAAARHELQALNMELFQLFLSVNFIDLARDRLRAVLDKSEPGDFTPEQRTRLAQDLAQLDERVNQVQNAMSEAAVEQQSNPIALASFAANQGAPGIAIHELEEADRTGSTPSLVKPRLIDLYCETGQPEKAIELFSTGTINDPAFGSEPGSPALRQGRAYALLGNDEYAATLMSKYAIPALRYTRANTSIAAATGLVRGGIKGTTAALLDIPEKIGVQAQWEFEAGLCHLEAGAPELAAEHFTKALTLVPGMPQRPIAAYYLEKIGKPVPPPPASSTTPAPSTEVKEPEKGAEAEKPEGKPTEPAEPKAEEKPKTEEKPKADKAEGKPAEPAGEKAETPKAEEKKAEEKSKAAEEPKKEGPKPE